MILFVLCFSSLDKWHTSPTCSSMRFYMRKEKCCNSSAPLTKDLPFCHLDSAFSKDSEDGVFVLPVKRDGWSGIVSHELEERVSEEKGVGEDSIVLFGDSLFQTLRGGTCSFFAGKEVTNFGFSSTTYKDAMWALSHSGTSIFPSSPALVIVHLGEMDIRARLFSTSHPSSYDEKVGSRSLSHYFASFHPTTRVVFVSPHPSHPSFDAYLSLYTEFETFLRTLESEQVSVVKWASYASSLLENQRDSLYKDGSLSCSGMSILEHLILHTIK